MKYERIVHGKFLERPNRFIAQVEIAGKVETVHVKNTGRCRELLLQGVEVLLEEANNPNRKTKYDLVSVYKKGIGWINIDSQAPNKIALEWLKTKDYDLVRPEFTYGNSRIDFYMEKGQERYLMEVKGCTLEVDGIGYFPDAPTKRGVKHLKELTKASLEGIHAMVAFVVQMEGIHEVRPNVSMDPDFGEALLEAQKAGVTIVNLCCRVLEDAVFVKGEVAQIL